MQMLDFSYDAEHDILTVEGLQYTGELFRSWSAHGLPLFAIFRLINRENTCITLERLDRPEAWSTPVVDFKDIPEEYIQKGEIK